MADDVRVRSHKRKENFQEAKVIVMTTPESQREHLSWRDRVKSDLRIPPKKKKPRVPQKTEADEFAEDTEKLAKTLEDMGD